MTHPRAPDLSPRQHQTLWLIGQGMTDKQIAARLGISAQTVKDVGRILRLKLGVANRAGAAAQAVRLGLA